jgi:hypothetical protein
MIGEFFQERSRLRPKERAPPQILAVELQEVEGSPANVTRRLRELENGTD